MKLKRDTLLGGRYNIRVLLGEGGMGVVYRARDEQLHRMVAIKTIQFDKASDRDFLKRFKREALAISQIEHPHIVRLFDFVEPGRDQPPYMVMELLTGKDLGTVIRETKGGLDITRAVTRTLEASVAIGECHRHGFLHRDVKPNNIFLHNYNHVEAAKVLDFGAVKQEERPERPNEDTAELTHRGSLLGTPYYMPPEQIRGLPVTARSDQYSLGVVLYTALTGRKPFEVDKGAELKDIELLRAIAKGQFTPVQELRRDIPIQLAATIHRAISVDPEKRFADLHGFGAALRSYASPQAQLTWEAHFTSSAPAHRDPQMSIAISAAAGGPLDGTTSVDPTLPTADVTRGTAPTVVAKPEPTIALSTKELKAGSDEIHFATTSRQPDPEKSRSLSLVIDEASQSREALPTRPAGEKRAGETTAPTGTRNKAALLVGGAAALFALVFGGALLLTHRKGPAAPLVTPPAELGASPPVAAPAQAMAPAPAAPAPPQPVPPAAPPPPRAPEDAPKGEEAAAPTAAEGDSSHHSAAAAEPKHHHKKSRPAGPQLDPHGLPIPTD